MKKLLLSAVLPFAGIFTFAQDPKPAAGTTPAATVAPAAPAPAPAAAGAAVELTLGAVPGTMLFDKKELTVAAGAKVKLTFTNQAGPLMHNFLLIKPGTKEAVGALADKMLTDPQAVAKQYCPECDSIVVKGNKLIGIGQSDVIEFTAPAEAGDYPYICTFPGHWRLMNGVLHVTK